MLNRTANSPAFIHNAAPPRLVHYILYTPVDIGSKTNQDMQTVLIARGAQLSRPPLAQP